jgi:hypothetical protein
VYHRAECIVDIIMIVAYWLSYVDEYQYIDCLLESIPVYSHFVYLRTHSIVIVQFRFFLTTFLNLLPIITNTLLAVDRCRSVKHPLEWKATFSKVVYAKRFIYKICACAFGVIIILNVLTFVLSYLSTNLCPLSGQAWYESYCCQYLAISTFIEYLVNLCVSVVLLIIITRSLIIFVYHLHARRSDKSADAKRIRTATNLVIGTLMPMYVLTVISMPGKYDDMIIYSLCDIAFVQQFVSKATVESWVILKDKTTRNQFEALLYNFRDYYSISIMLSSVMTVFVHMFTCAAYRRGAKKFVLGIFCKKIATVHPLNTGTTQASKKTTLRIT